MDLRNQARAYAPHVALVLSGVAGLGYEIVWTRMLSAGLGHEIHAVLAVVTAFFCGSALGAIALDGRVRASSRPGAWYAGLEFVIAAWSLALPSLVPALNRAAITWIGVEPSSAHHWGVAFGAAFLALLPATFAMGATLPAIERVVASARGPGQSIGGLYAANTAGAVAGLAMTTFWLAPAIGLAGTSRLLAAVNVAAAIVAIVTLREKTPLAAAAAPANEARGVLSPRTTASPTALLATLFTTGLLGVGYEVLAVRVLSQVLENTVYSFANTLAIYLIGTACGAAIYQWRGRSSALHGTLVTLLLATSAASLAGVFVLANARHVHDALRVALGSGGASSLTAEAVVTLCVLLIPTAFMGALFSHLAREALTTGVGLGRALAANTLGCALAPLGFGVLVLPLTGARVALVAVGLGYTLVAVARRRMATSRARLLPSLVPLAMGAILVATPGALIEAPLAKGEHVVAHRDGIMASVTITADERNARRLVVNDRFPMGGTSSAYSDRREAHIPLLLHADPERVLFLGLGAGVTFAAAASHPGMHAEGVELVPEIVELLPHFESATGDLRNAPALRVRVADARRFVLATTAHYDVVVADLFHPARDGAGGLYTVEHFAAVRDVLESDGIFCQWLPLYQMDIETLKLVVRSFLRVFPEARAVLAHHTLEQPIIGLIGFRASAPIYDEQWLEKRAATARLSGELAALGIGNTFDLLGTHLAGAKALADFAGDGPLNTDDRPLVIYRAPEFVYRSVEAPRDRLLHLVAAFSSTDEVLGSPGTEMRARLAAYHRARGAFLHAGASARPSQDVRVMLAQVRAPLLAVLRESPDFRPARDPLVSMARHLATLDPPAAEALLAEIDAIQR